MSISFILTSYNIRNYLHQSLRSLAMVARSGDELIIVDDGSTDGSAELISGSLNKFGFDLGVRLVPLCLGANTKGGVGVPANIGLSMATRETIFFVDGDDWIDVDGFNQARAEWEMNPADILIANYRVFDEIQKKSKRPADSNRWNKLKRSTNVDAGRLQALSMIGVPWRKFYCRSFIETHQLRFPEGEFFYEDNPFHWAVCLSAKIIQFRDVAVCHHRVNRPGQTMAENGMALIAFFTHFETIMGMLQCKDNRFHLAALNWLVGNMTWHSERLSHEIFYPYAVRAATALSTIPDELWAKAFAKDERLHPIWFIAERLRRGDVSGQVASWENARLNRRLNDIEAQLVEINYASKGSLDRLRGQDAASVFAAVRANSS